MAVDDFRFAPILKDPAESLIVTLDWFNLCANFWRPNEQFTAAEYVRPNIATGFAYQAGGNGTSASREPRWPFVLSGSVTDGSITWAATAASTNGLNAISAPTASAPTGITAGSLAVVETTKLQVTYSSGVDGQNYDVPFTVTVAGIPRIGRQRVQVRTR